MSAINIIQRVARKLLTQNQPKGVITIPNRMTAESKAGEIAATLQRAGLSMDRFDEFITSETDLIRLLNQIEAFEKKNLADNIRSGIRNTESAKVFSIKNKKEIPNPEKNIMGGQAFETEEEIAKRIAKENKDSIQRIKDKKTKDFNKEVIDRAGTIIDEDPEKFANGGRIGFNTGSGLPLDPMDPDNKLNAVINAFKKLPLRSQNRIGFKKFFEIYARENFADGGRIGFKMGRRAFLKALGAGIGGAAAFKTGIIGLGGKKAVTGAGEKIITAPVKGKPEWFDSLVNKVITQGDDVSKNFATKEREIVHKLDIDNLDDVRVTQDLDEGMIKVEYNSPNNMGEDTVELVFKSGRSQMDETTGKVADEFYAVEKEPRGIRVGPDDYDIEFDGENLVRSVDDLQSDTSKLKEVATGKKQTLGEFVNSKKKKDKVKQINEDQVEQAEYLEQKYGPGPEDTDDFASGGLAGMLGQ